MGWGGGGKAFAGLVPPKPPAESASADFIGRLKATLIIFLKIKLNRYRRGRKPSDPVFDPAFPVFFFQSVFEVARTSVLQ